MDRRGIDARLTTRVRQKFEKLDETCMERYQTREQRVLTTLNFCMTALDQLQSWALFAIFPLDEQNGDRYTQFVEQRFQCVATPLRTFQQTLERHHGLMPSSPRGPRDLRSNSPREQRVSPRDFRSGSLESTHGSSGSDSSTGRETLRDKISHITRQYVEEGQMIRKAVVQRLQKCRKDMRTIYRWGQASLMDLSDLIDESLADELYFLVRGKMARIQSAISAFDEAAEQIEKNLSHYFQDQPKADGLDTQFDGPEFTLELPTRDSPRYDPMDLRLSLDELVIDAGNMQTPRMGAEKGERLFEDNLDSGDSTRGSTPEPPVSPRPKGLVNHPKIMKDKLQSYALPSKFGTLRFNTW